jgi:hypothetical protein
MITINIREVEIIYKIDNKIIIIGYNNADFE